MSLRYDAVLFDLDGTLIDSYDALTEALNYCRVSEAMSPLRPEEVKDLVGEGVERLLQKAFARHDINDIRRTFEERYDEVCCSMSRILDEVEWTLPRLATEGIAMAVCTNKPTIFSTKILDHLGLAGYFRAVVGPDLAGARKPSADHVLYTLATTGSPPDRALFVGDMPIDIVAARSSGIAVAVLPTGSSTREELEASSPDFLLERFSEIERLVRP